MGSKGGTLVLRVVDGRKGHDEDIGARLHGKIYLRSHLGHKGAACVWDVEEGIVENRGIGKCVYLYQSEW
jgi:hypothetical protein